MKKLLERFASPPETPSGFSPEMPRVRYSPGARWSIVRTPSELQVVARPMRSLLGTGIGVALVAGLLVLLVWLPRFGLAGWFATIPAALGTFGVAEAMFWSQIKQHKLGPALVHRLHDDTLEFPRLAKTIGRSEVKAIEVVHASGGENSYCDFLVLVLNNGAQADRHIVVISNTSNSSSIARRLSTAWSVPHSTHSVRPR